MQSDQKVTGGVAEWDLSREREFIENLLCQRFDFFLVFYSLMVAGAFQTKNPLNFALAFTVGAIVCGLLAVSISRTQNKLESILERIAEEDPDHASAFTEVRGKARAEERGLGSLIGGSGRYIVGYWIPWICFFSLLMAAVLAWTGRLTP